ncbi:MAG: hypothetical protein PCFJNLEI_01290 [Verrucomicrobiae bacterium]|nr:hypothetical protein [Verrucomicrobiae bacterium]
MSIIAKSSSGSDVVLRGQSLQVERKHFTFELKENSRGRFLRITEEVNGRYDAIVVPITGLEQFRDALSEIIKLAKSQAPPV